MNVRSTNRARKVIRLAHQEAQRLNHEYIGTEHILLGLIKEGSGTAVHVLRNLDIDLRKPRQEIEKICQKGPELVIMDRLPQTPRAKKVFEYSILEARNLNHNYVGTEHLLLGLLREQEGVAGQVLRNLGLKLEDAREEILNLLGHNLTREELHEVVHGQRIAELAESLRDEETLYEVVDGRRVEKPPMEVYACRIVSILCSFLDQFARAHQRGRVSVETLFLLVSDGGIERRPDVAFASYQRPDVAVVSYQRWPKDRKMPRTNAWDVVPELAIEVISKTNTAEEIQVKIHDYFRAGVQLVWIIFPVPGLVHAYEASTRVRILQRHEELDGGSVLPDFRLPVATLFEDELEEVPPAADA